MAEAAELCESAAAETEKAEGGEPMDVEPNPASKRPREEDGIEQPTQDQVANDGTAKKPKSDADTCVGGEDVYEEEADAEVGGEELRGEGEAEEGGAEEEEGGGGEEGEEEEEEEVEEGGKGEGRGVGGGGGEVKVLVSTAVSLGPKTFSSSSEMYDYFIKLLNYWPPNVNVNKYEFTVLVELLNKGYEDPKEVEGVCAFQVRNHPVWKTPCFFFIKEDGSLNDFSFGKCIKMIFPSLAPRAPANRGSYHRGGRGRGRIITRGRGNAGMRGGRIGGGGGGGGRGNRGGRGGRGGGRHGRGRRGRGQY